MIILDANILKSVSLRGLEAELLRAIRASGVEEIAAPWIAVEEIAAQEALRYAEKYDRVATELDTLDKATPWETVSHPRRAQPEEVRSHWRDRYAEIVHILQTSPQAYQQALFREANLLAPCKAIGKDGHKTGARDAAIWLTAVEYARDNPGQSVYFVTADGDFGTADSLPDQMAQDLARLGGRFVRYTSLTDVLTKFASPVTIDEETVKEALCAEHVLRSVSEAARDEAGRRRFEGVVLPSESATTQLTFTFLGWPADCGPAVALGEVRDVRAHEINGQTWCTATARWLLAGHIEPYSEGRTINLSWQTRVMLRPGAPEEGITITRPQRGETVTQEDVPHLPALDHSHEVPRVQVSRLEAEIVNLAIRNVLRHGGDRYPDIVGALRSASPDSLSVAQDSFLPDQRRDGRPNDVPDPT
ncbi:PIN domain-containing protein [Streptomyces katrae]|uniref:PIN domain-containing protein n=1 Tax=Streptomyces katrae TaxID=68223 RepID=UPI0004C0CA68|nr:PIN domain-containing protein [Streptomyces katrae]